MENLFGDQIQSLIVAIVSLACFAQKQQTQAFKCHGVKKKKKH